MKEKERTRIAFLFKGGRRARLNDVGSGPREFFYGFTGLKEAGVPVELVEEDDFGAVPSLWWTGRRMTGLIHRLTGLSAPSVAKYAQADVLSRLNAYGAIVATTNSQGLTMAFLRARGRLKAPVLFIPMGVLELNAPPLKRAVCRWLLRHVAVTPISRAEEAYLNQQLGPGPDIKYLPFGVDARFWSAAGNNKNDGDYVLSIGNDWSRDYATLACAWRPEYPPLKIVTGLPVPPSVGSVEIIAGDWKRQLLSDEDVRDLFRGARFIILPLRQTVQPSGQSACLQAMACGKAVILSDIAGLWNREIMADGKICLLTPPGSVEGMQKAVEELLSNLSRVSEMGRLARQAVDEHLNLEIMTTALRFRLEALL